MTRRRARQRRAQEVCTQEVRAEEGHGVYRLTRARRRACRIRQARAALVRRGALLLSVSGVCLMRAALAAAAAHEAMHEMTGDVQALRDARTQLADYHAAQRNLREARKGVQTAQENLAAAQAGKKEAARALADARQNLAASREALREAQQALAAARAVAAEKSQAAQSAQQAVADYAPEVEALRSDAAAAAAESARAEGAYEAAAAAAQAAMQRDREAAVAAACEAVGYEQRRLEEAQRLADEALAAMPDRMEEVESSYRGWLDALAASLDASEAALSDAEAQLDDLMSAAEDAAMEAADAQQEAAQAEAEAAQAAAEAEQQEKEEAAAEDDVREAEDWAREAVADLVSAQVWEREAAEQVAHFGEGEGVQAGFEYYSWRGRRAGHQLYLPLSYFASRRQDGHMVDFSLWNRSEVMEKILEWYDNKAYPYAKQIAERQHFKGIRWMKMTDPWVGESPSNVGSFLTWQQPHYIYMAEEMYRHNPSAATVAKYAKHVEETAEFMADFALSCATGNGPIRLYGQTAMQESLSPSANSVTAPSEVSQSMRPLSSFT